MTSRPSGAKPGTPIARKSASASWTANSTSPTTPARADWAANLFANPEFTYHLKESVQRDLRVRASIVRDPAEKRAILERILEKENALDQVDARVAGSHLFRVEVVE